jgi:formiminotetrahydrofolate cyclodeaminase
MPASLWDQTLAEFRERLATRESVPAGVSVAAVSATFALGLLVKILDIASKRRDFAGDHALAQNLINDARVLMEVLARQADEDIVAYQHSAQAAIEVPLDVARATASGLALCDQAAALIHAAVAPDLTTAHALLTAAGQAVAKTTEANIQRLPEADPYRAEAAAALAIIKAQK